MSDIIERAESALAGIRDRHWIICGAEELESVTKELVSELKAARVEIIRLTPNEAGYAGRD